MMAGCDSVFIDEEVENVVSEHTYQKYLRFAKNIEVDMDPSKRWCPRPNCGRYVTVNDKLFIECSCGTQICALCGEEASESHQCGPLSK